MAQLWKKGFLHRFSCCMSTLILSSNISISLYHWATLNLHSPQKFTIFLRLFHGSFDLSIQLHLLLLPPLSRNAHLQNASLLLNISFLEADSFQEGIKVQVRSSHEHIELVIPARFGSLGHASQHPNITAPPGNRTLRSLTHGNTHVLKNALEYSNPGSDEQSWSTAAETKCRDIRLASIKLAPAQCKTPNFLSFDWSDFLPSYLALWCQRAEARQQHQGRKGQNPS